MKNIWGIFKTDLNHIRKKRAAIVVVIALMILPSMYAWFNILPSWDPYANTENVSVAIVNNDDGVELEGELVNVGGEIVSSLKENKQLGWQFVDEEEAERGLEKGDYYASIIIPANFTEKLTSVLDDEPEKPVLDYYINAKVNAIAPKVTNAGATGIVESVHEGFIKVANEAIFSAFNEAGIELEANKENIERLRDAIYQLEDDMPEIDRLLGVAEDDLQSAEDASEKVHEGIKRAEEVSDEVQALSERIKGILDETDQYVKEYIPIIKSDLAVAETVTKEIPELIDHMSEKEEIFDEVILKIENSTDKIDEVIEGLQLLEEVLENADQEANNSEQIATFTQQLEEDYDQLEQTKQDLEAAIEIIDNGSDENEKSLEQLKAMVEIIETRQTGMELAIEASKQVEKSIADGIFIDGAKKIDKFKGDLKQFKEAVLKKVAEAEVGKTKLTDVLEGIDEQAVQINQTINDLLIFIDHDLLPTYNQEMSTARTAVREADEKIEKVISYFPKIEEILNKIDSGIDIGKKELDKINDAFPEAKEKVLELAKKTRELENKGDIAELINFLRNDPAAEGEFFADPIILKEHELFPIPNYGSAMAPFFTALALWVGGLILVSSLIVDVPDKHRYKSYEAYFGRFLTFWSIGLVQTLIVTCGNMFLLKTYVLHKILFILFAFLISTTFVVIIYTLVSVFGNTGKVMAIILLVMQLGASGGTFPIQTTPDFFQKIHQFMPFTHGLGLFREATAGIVWSVALTHIAWLIGYIAVFLFIGIKLKETINKRSDKFMEEARESKIIL